MSYYVQANHATVPKNKTSTVKCKQKPIKTVAIWRTLQGLKSSNRTAEQWKRQLNTLSKYADSNLIPGFSKYMKKGLRYFSFTVGR